MAGYVEHWDGCVVYIPDGKFRLYVRSKYRGKIDWTCDYTHARKYTQATAERMVKELNAVRTNAHKIRHTV